MTESTRERYERFRKAWNEAHDKLMTDRPLVVLDLGDAPDWEGDDVDFDHGVDVEFEDAESEIEEGAS